MLKIIVTPDHGYAKHLKKAAAMGARHSQIPIPDMDHAHYPTTCDDCYCRIWVKQNQRELCDDCKATEKDRQKRHDEMMTSPQQVIVKHVVEHVQVSEELKEIVH